MKGVFNVVRVVYCSEIHLSSSTICVAVTRKICSQLEIVDGVTQLMLLINQFGIRTATSAS
jgi:hypothetical protein